MSDLLNHVDVWSSVDFLNWGESILVFLEWRVVNNIVVIARDWVTVDWILALNDWSILLVKLNKHCAIVRVGHSVVVITWVSIRGNISGNALGNGWPLSEDGSIMSVSHSVVVVAWVSIGRDVTGNTLGNGWPLSKDGSIMGMSHTVVMVAWMSIRGNISSNAFSYRWPLGGAHLLKGDSINTGEECGDNVRLHYFLIL